MIEVWIMLILINPVGICGGGHSTTQIYFKTKEQCINAANNYPRNGICDEVKCVQGLMPSVINK